MILSTLVTFEMCAGLSWTPPYNSVWDWGTAHV